MTVESAPIRRFRRLLLFRRRGTPTQILRVLEDGDGWLYVVNLAGTPDFGPYLNDEIVSAFDVESEPCAERDLDQGPSTADQTGPRNFAPEQSADEETQSKHSEGRRR
jgi:hypothetical protein